MCLHAPQQGGAFARVAQTIADADALLGAIDLVRVESREVVRDVTVACVDSGHAEAVVRDVMLGRLSSNSGVEVPRCRP
jgi:malate dehydrogenase (oxaloacetate-decarboxylating)